MSKDCKELHDVRVTATNENPNKVFDPEWKLPVFYCPKSKKHLVKEWNHPGPCPKCSATMNKGHGLVEWD
jgi:hypothetical protein